MGRSWPPRTVAASTGSGSVEHASDQSDLSPPPDRRWNQPARLRKLFEGSESFFATGTGLGGEDIGAAFDFKGASSAAAVAPARSPDRLPEASAVSCAAPLTGT